MRYGLLCLVLAAGCGGPDPRSRSFEVTGTVTLDGQPVAAGKMTLIPDDPSLSADAGPIADGQYKFLASAGRKTVVIHATREVPQPGPKDVPRNPKFEDYIPAKYHEKSELSMEVVPGGENRFDFPLKSD